MFKKFILISVSLIFFSTNVYSEILSKVEVNGNKRLTKDSILVFGKIDIEEDINKQEINLILKRLYSTNFFKNVSIKINDKTLVIDVKENPIIQSLTINGIKAKKLKNPILNALTLRDKSSFVLNLVKSDEDKIINLLRNKGYFFSKVESSIIKITDDIVDLIYNVKLGKKAKIGQIKFIGEKKIKDRKLKNVIVSEESKFWKFLSSSKYLNLAVIDLDKRLLINYYKNKGYYNVSIESSFAQLVKNDYFDLVYKINAGNKFYYNNIILNLPVDYDEKNFSKILSLFKKLKGEKFSLNSIAEILEEIDQISILEQYQFINASVEEKIISNNQLDIVFNIAETEKKYVERVNIYGNNVTIETVIRNNLKVDEGDPFNELLHKKSINNLKSLNFFKTVTSEIIDGKEDNTKIINITIDEKPTGEISAGAGIGTSGGTLAFSVKENNYLGKGINFETSLQLSEEKIKGIFSVVNPNINGTNKSLNARVESTETNRLKNFGYKSTKTGLAIGTSYEQYQDTYLSASISSFYENLKTDTTASSSLQKQKGDSFSTDLLYGIDFDKRNQKFQTTDGFRSRFNQSIPLVNDSFKFQNTYEYNYFKELPKDIIGTFSVYGSTVTSLNNKDIKISDRLYLSSRKLRGFEQGKIGPVDGNDYVGGNYATAMNIATTLPNLFPTFENIDFSLFYDAANVWGVDYNSLLSDSNIFRSAFGVSIDWFTPIGPLSFSLAETLTQATTDQTEKFRFNLGTTF